MYCHVGYVKKGDPGVFSIQGIRSEDIETLGMSPVLNRVR